MFRFAGMTKSAAVIALAVLGPFALPADAALINFSTGGDLEVVSLSNGLTAEVDLDPTADSINLTPGVAELVDINMGTFDFFALSAAVGNDTLSQTLTITSPASTPTARTISQPVLVETEGQTIFDPAIGNVFVSAGSPVTFDLGPEGVLTVTPVGGSAVNRELSPAFFANRAEFLLTAVPEPVALPLLAGGALAFTMRRRRVV